MKLIKAKNDVQGGSALVVTLMTVMLLTALIGVAFEMSGTQSQISNSSQNIAQLRFAAEGAMDMAYGIWLTAAAAKYGPPQSTDLPSRIRGPSPSPLVNWPTTMSPKGFIFAYSSTASAIQINCVDSYGAPTTSSTGTPVHMAAYPGWSGYDYSYIESVRLSSTTAAGRAVDYGLRRSIDYVNVPLFQAMGFFEDDLEFYKPANMEIEGLIHTNGNAYISTQQGYTLQFDNNVSYVGSYYSTNTFPTGATAYSPGGTIVAPTYLTSTPSQVSTMEPLGTSESSYFTGNGNPNEDSMRFLIEPPNTSYTDPSALSQRRLYTKAGIIIAISGSNKTITTQNGVTLTSAQQSSILAGLSQQQGKTFYDTREASYMDVTTVDISVIAPILNSVNGYNGTSENGVLYIYDATAATTTDTNEKAIRLTNGSVLPTNGLTVATENPLYIQGDYNVGNEAGNINNVPTNAAGTSQVIAGSSTTTSPVVSGYSRPSSAVMADAVTILSNGWKDTNSSSSLSSRDASNTTVNTAILAGSVPGTATNYSGGFNNFPRFLEDWSGNSFTYYGSMIQMFHSAIATGLWDTGNIYSPPSRFWNYDSNLLAKSPPGSLDAVSWSRGALTRY